MNPSRNSLLIAELQKPVLWENYPYPHEVCRNSLVSGNSPIGLRYSETHDYTAKWQTKQGRPANRPGRPRQHCATQYRPYKTQKQRMIPPNKTEVWESRKHFTVAEIAKGGLYKNGTARTFLHTDLFQKKQCQNQEAFLTATCCMSSIQ